MYKLSRVPGYITTDDGATTFPRSEGNADYLKFLAWEAQGNTPLPADPAPPPTQGDLDVAEARGDADVQEIAGMTPGEAAEWIDVNVTSLAAAKIAMRRMAKVICILARRI